MRRAFELLHLLHDGAEHSGGELATRLGITRSAVWNHVDTLRKQGIDVRATRGRGYRLEGGFEALDAERIDAAVRRYGTADIAKVEVVTVTDSTNERLLARAARDDIHGCVLLAEYQTAGRGRRGDSWIAPPGSGLCLSLGWRFELPPATLSALGLVMGVAVVTSLREHGAQRVTLKWPNDVLLDGRKVAGILIEMRSEASGPCTAVIGVGLNLRLSPQAQVLIDQPSGDLESAVSAPVSRNGLGGAVISELVACVRRFAVQGFDAFRTAWERDDALAGRSITLELPGRVIAGVARGVDRGGALVVEHAGARESFMAGHVRLA